MPIEPEPDDNLIAAAEAAASWARARRAKWTDRPLPKSVEPGVADPLEFEFEAQPQPPPPRPAPPPAAPSPAKVATPAPRVSFEPPVEFEPAVTFEPEISFEAPRPAAVTPPPPAPKRVRKAPALAEPIKRWAPRIAAAAALVGGAVVAAPYALNALSNLKARATASPQPKANPEPAAAAPHRTTGTLEVTTTPPGAQVIVDGKPRGATPLELTDISPGKHEVVVRSEAGAVRRTVTIAAGKSVAVDEAIFAGFIAVYSPFEVTISEGGHVLRPDERNQIMVPPGVHNLRFVNDALGFDISRQVEVKPGEGATVRLTPEPSRLSVTATEGAEVFLDGTRIGEVPLSNVPVALGTHDLLVRRTADGAERRSTITVGVAPFTQHVDFSKPGA